MTILGNPVFVDGVISACIFQNNFVRRNMWSPYHMSPFVNCGEIYYNEHAIFKRRFSVPVYFLFPRKLCINVYTTTSERSNLKLPYHKWLQMYKALWVLRIQSDFDKETAGQKTENQSQSNCKHELTSFSAVLTKCVIIITNNIKCVQ